MQKGGAAALLYIMLLSALSYLQKNSPAHDYQAEHDSQYGFQFHLLSLRLIYFLPAPEPLAATKCPLGAPDDEKRNAASEQQSASDDKRGELPPVAIQSELYKFAVSNLYFKRHIKRGFFCDLDFHCRYGEIILRHDGFLYPCNA